MTAKRSIRESTGRWTFSSVEAIGTKNNIAKKPARIHGSGRLVLGKASRDVGLAASGDTGRRSGAVQKGAGARSASARAAGAVPVTTYQAGCEGDTLIARSASGRRPRRRRVGRVS
jgi:hypothetical protein